MKIYHGGCLGCKKQYKYGRNYCNMCQYKNANWSLPDLSSKAKCRYSDDCGCGCNNRCSCDCGCDRCCGESLGSLVLTVVVKILVGFACFTYVVNTLIGG
jgi:hypothetical protein